MSTNARKSFVFSVDFKGTKTCEVFAESLDEAMEKMSDDEHKPWEVDDEDYTSDFLIFSPDGTELIWSPSSGEVKESDGRS